MIANINSRAARRTTVSATISILVVLALPMSACGRMTMPIPDSARPCIPNDGGLDYDVQAIPTRSMGQIGVSSVQADNQGNVTMEVFGNIFDVPTTGDVDHCGRGYITFQSTEPLDGGTLLDTQCVIPMSAEIGTFTGTSWRFNFRVACRDFLVRFGEPFGRSFNLWVTPASHVITNDMQRTDGTCGHECFYVGILGPTMTALQSQNVRLAFP